MPLPIPHPFLVGLIAAGTGGYIALQRSTAPLMTVEMLRANAFASNGKSVRVRAFSLDTDRDTLILTDDLDKFKNTFAGTKEEYNRASMELKYLTGTTYAPIGETRADIMVYVTPRPFPPPGNGQMAEVSGTYEAERNTIHATEIKPLSN